MKIDRQFTTAGQDVYANVKWSTRTSRISNPDGRVVFEMTNAEVPESWSQLATDIMVSKYFRKAGVPQTDCTTGPETSARQVIHRLAGCWRHWGETHDYFDTAEDAQAFYDELAYMLLHQMAAPNSPQWFNTGLNWAYGITGPAQGHYYCDPKSGQLRKASNAYEHPQPHACFIQSVGDDLVGHGGIMDLWTREARLFKYGSGTGTNFSHVRGENEPLSGGGKSSGLMSFLKIGDRAAGAIKSGGTTRRAAKMVCLDLDHPDIEDFVSWKVREELKVACMVEGLKHLPGDQKATAKKLGLILSYDFNGEAYATVSGQNSNNSVRISNDFFHALEEDGEWQLWRRTDGKLHKTIKARDLWEQITFAAWRSADPGVQFDSTINQWHTCPAGGRINASNPCVTGDTRVLTPGGIWRRIDQMIHLPSRVITNLPTHESSGQEIHVTEGSFPTGNKDVFELTTESGYTLKLTRDHKVWSTSRGWVEAQHLTRNDEILLPAQPAAVEQVGEPQDPRLFHLVGFLMSNANADANALSLQSCMEDADQRELFDHYIARHWGISGTSRDRQEAVTVDSHANVDSHEQRQPLPDGRGSLSTIAQAHTNRRLLSRLRAFVTTTREGDLRLSDDAFTCGLAAQKHILRGLFTADGQVTRTSIVLHHTSTGLLADLQTLLLGFGIKSSRNTGFQPVPGNNHGLETRSTSNLRIDPGSLRRFCQHINVLPGEKQALLASIAATSVSSDRNSDAVSNLEPLGVLPVFDLTEPATSSFIANGLTVHNCSEYMFLDDTACNLASLNVLTFFDSGTKSFDLPRYQHAVRLWTIVLEISVLMASFPSESIAEKSYRYRTLGLGYANLGAMLMQAGIPYDSDRGRAICAALTSIMTGETYATSAEMAAQLGAFAGYAENADNMLRVIRNHARAAEGTGARRHQGTKGATDNGPPTNDYEGLDIHPVEIDAAQFDGPLASPVMLETAREVWTRALAAGQRHGYRNAQTTVIAPTGTIGLLMDCDTTGVEPDFALVKFKKLAGGGYFKIANQSLRPALRNLGLSETQQQDVLTHVLGTLKLADAPHVNRNSLIARGFLPAELDAIEKNLHAVFELGFAFSAYGLADETLRRLGVSDAAKVDPRFSLLRHMGFTRKQIDEANDVICGSGTVEGAPHLTPAMLPVFDCANKCGKHGTRYIAAEGHIRMMAAAQPFITGAISKTINLPHEATVDDIARCYELSWKLGLKANALYRDGSKLSQPLNVKSDEEMDDEESEENVEAGREQLASDAVAVVVSVSDGATKQTGGTGVPPVLISGTSGTPVPPNTSKTAGDINIVRADKPIERIIERIVERPLRRRLPDTRSAKTHKFDVAGHEGYITVGLYDDNTPGEVFITMAKEGSTIGGLMDTIATLVSVSLQYGVPVESLVRKFEHVRFEPNGMTRNRDIPMAKSLVDYIFRWMAMEFVPGYRAANAPSRPEAEATERRSDEATKGKNGNGNGHRNEHPDAKPVTKDDLTMDGAQRVAIGAPTATDTEAQPSVATQVAQTYRRSVTSNLAADPLSQQGADMQSDAPACDTCGSITVRSGTCYKCLNCGASMGCS